MRKIAVISGRWIKLVAFALILAAGAGCAALSFPCALAIFWVLKKTIGIRVSADEELRGLDLGEHGMEAYAGFQIFSNQ